MGKWMAALAAGLAAAIIGGVVVWWLTRPGGALNPTVPPAASVSAPVEERSFAVPPPGTASAPPDGRHTRPAKAAPATSGEDLLGHPHQSRPLGRYSQSFLLHDGGQQPILDGLASVGAEFTRVGEMEVATLHVNMPGKNVVHHAIISAGERFEVEAAGRSYYMYATGVDPEARTLSVRIEEVR